MGGKTSGNKRASGKKGHKGGTGRPPKLPEDKRSKHVLMSPRLWDKINFAAMEAGEASWHSYLEKVLEGRSASRKFGSATLAMGIETVPLMYVEGMPR
jgi:hypothetical protein